MLAILRAPLSPIISNSIDVDRKCRSRGADLEEDGTALIDTYVGRESLYGQITGTLTVDIPHTGGSSGQAVLRNDRVCGITALGLCLNGKAEKGNRDHTENPEAI